jgi:hypothetical protein
MVTVNESQSIYSTNKRKIKNQEKKRKMEKRGKG